MQREMHEAVAVKAATMTVAVGLLRETVQAVPAERGRAGRLPLGESGEPRSRLTPPFKGLCQAM